MYQEICGATYKLLASTFRLSYKTIYGVRQTQFVDAVTFTHNKASVL